MAATSFLALPAAAQDQTPIPNIAQALLDTAYETGDPAEVRAVTNAVRTVFPDYQTAIDAQSAERIAELVQVEEESSEDAAPAEPAEGPMFALKSWDGKIKAGASLASGNSDNFAAGLSIDAARTAGDWVHNFTAYIDFAESNGVTNQKRWGASYQLDYKFSERTYAYGRFSYDEDEFSGFDYRLFFGAGAGHFLYKAEELTWKIEGGPGYRISPIDDTREVERELAVYAASETDWVIRDGVVFEQDFNVTWTSPTTTFQSISALTTDITDAISTAISFEYRFETDPPLGREQTDTIARASLVYGF